MLIFSGITGFASLFVHFIINTMPFIRSLENQQVADMCFFILFVFDTLWV